MNSLLESLNTKIQIKYKSRVKKRNILAFITQHLKVLTLLFVVIATNSMANDITDETVYEDLENRFNNNGEAVINPYGIAGDIRTQDWVTAPGPAALINGHDNPFFVLMFSIYMKNQTNIELKKLILPLIIKMFNEDSSISHTKILSDTVQLLTQINGTSGQPWPMPTDQQEQTIKDLVAFLKADYTLEQTGHVIEYILYGLRERTWSPTYDSFQPEFISARNRYNAYSMEEQ